MAVLAGQMAQFPVSVLLALIPTMFAVAFVASFQPMVEIKRSPFGRQCINSWGWEWEAAKPRSHGVVIGTSLFRFPRRIESPATEDVPA